MPAEIILSIDPALRCTGYAVLARQGKAVRVATYGLIRNAPKIRPSGCLLAIRDALGGIIGQYQPAAMAVEGVIFVQSYQTAITLGAARGAAILAATEKGLAVHEYSPRSVKQAVVGRGAADKQQVAFMVRALLGLTETPPPDAADAIAVGIAHFHAVDAARVRRGVLPVI
jgi:crossover junction endodeoxyribonuclease RuvC